MESPARRWRDIEPVDAALSGPADELRFPLPVHPDAVEEPLRRVIGRGRDVDPAAFLVDGVDGHDIVVARCQELGRTAVAADRIGVLPAVTLAEPQQSPAAVEPDEV